MILNFPNPVTTPTAYASDITAGTVFVDATSDNERATVLAVRDAKRINNSDNVRVLGFVISEDRFAPFKLDGSRQVDVIGHVDSITVTHPPVQMCEPPAEVSVQD